MGLSSHHAHPFPPRQADLDSNGWYRPSGSRTHIPLQKTFDLTDFPSEWQRNLGKVLLQKKKKKTFLLFILEKKSRILISDSFHLKWRRCCPSNLHIFFAIFQLKFYSWDRLMIWLWHIWVSYLCDVSPSQWLRYQSFYKDCYLAAELQIWLGDLQISGYSPWHKIPLENSCSNQAWIWYNEDKAIFFWHF